MNTNDEQATYAKARSKELDTIMEAITAALREGQKFNPSYDTLIGHVRDAKAAADRLEAHLSAQHRPNNSKDTVSTFYDPMMGGPMPSSKSAEPQQPCPPHIIHEAIGGGWVCSACEARFDVP